MIVPRLAHETLLADVAAARQNDTALHVWWLGQSGFLVQWRGTHLLLDPYLSDSLTNKYAATDKPLEAGQREQIHDVLVAAGLLDDAGDQRATAKFGSRPEVRRENRWPLQGPARQQR